MDCFRAILIGGALVAFLSRHLCGLIGALALSGLAGAAQAQTPCSGAAPAVGAQLHGPVLHVLDADHLCVALGATPDQWVEIQLAPEPVATTATLQPSRGSLMAVAFAQTVTCRVVDRAGDLPVAACRLDDQSLRGLTRQPAAYVAGQAWR